MTNKKFYENGLHFECQGSGKCCTSRGAYGYVYLTLKDRKRFAAHFEVTTSQFKVAFCEKTEGYLHLKNPETNCRFLDGKRCSVYEARPEQCRTWPFWPENMDAKGWTQEVAEYCPGIGKGRLHAKEEIEEQLNRDPLASA